MERVSGCWWNGCPDGRGIRNVDLVELAYLAGFDVYIIDGFQLSNYRKGVGGRSKTDASDARLLARFLKNEGEELRPWTPPPAAYGKLQSLLRRRASLVQARTSLTQSWANDASLKSAFATFLKSIERLDLLIKKKLKDVLREAGLMEQVARCQAIEGIGFLTATALVMAYSRGDFKRGDSYIAFLGMDLRVADSGQKNGRRSLSKRGCSEIRRLLHNAAMSASRSGAWKEFYNYHRSRGKATTQVLVMLARKLARVAFALMKNQSEYRTKGQVMA
ncbi:ISPpu10, transposase [Pseudomonas syringae pv. delphinii]|uniref:ISPpu10, transposase n=1 Tax=Pseudomonas syringae pv. delphinii TaxID=192088 RepID=A0A0N8RBQ4_9PSED|nr:ISPpu10, transposase [Pseudomonas syringae pv. delphinii]RMQ19863.1 ISPpu10, transposase [Pseudomonas syringae pv. delphinii]